MLCVQLDILNVPTWVYIPFRSIHGVLAAPRRPCHRFPAVAYLPKVTVTGHMAPFCVFYTLCKRKNTICALLRLGSLAVGCVEMLIIREHSAPFTGPLYWETSGCFWFLPGRLKLEGSVPNRSIWMNNWNTGVCSVGYTPVSRSANWDIHPFSFLNGIPRWLGQWVLSPAMLSKC
jgi:hypothetical protein